MTVPSGDYSTPTVESVHAYARQLLRDVKRVNHDAADDAPLKWMEEDLKGLHQALKYLHVESQDQDSVLKDTSRDNIYAKRLASAVEDSDEALREVDDILRQYGDGRDGVNDRLQLRLNLLDLESPTRKIAKLLDAVQVHNPENAQEVLDHTDGKQLDMIKDKLERVATRMFQNRASPTTEMREDTWQTFKEELEKEGFSPEILRKNKVSDTYCGEWPFCETASSHNGNRRFYERISANSRPTNPPTPVHRRPFVVCSITMPRPTANKIVQGFQTMTPRYHELCSRSITIGPLASIANTATMFKPQTLQTRIPSLDPKQVP